MYSLSESARNLSNSDTKNTNNNVNDGRQEQQQQQQPPVRELRSAMDNRNARGTTVLPKRQQSKGFTSFGIVPNQHQHQRQQLGPSTNRPSGGGNGNETSLPPPLRNNNPGVDSLVFNSVSSSLAPPPRKNLSTEGGNGNNGIILEPRLPLHYNNNNNNNPSMSLIPPIRAVLSGDEQDRDINNNNVEAASSSPTAVAGETVSIPIPPPVLRTSTAPPPPTDIFNNHYNNDHNKKKTHVRHTSEGSHLHHMMMTHNNNNNNPRHPARYGTNNNNNTTIPIPNLNNNNNTGKHKRSRTTEDAHQFFFSLKPPVRRNLSPQRPTNNNVDDNHGNATPKRKIIVQQDLSDFPLAMDDSPVVTTKTKKQLPKSSPSPELKDAPVPSPTPTTTTTVRPPTRRLSSNQPQLDNIAESSPVVLVGIAAEPRHWDSVVSEQSLPLSSATRKNSSNSNGLSTAAVATEDLSFGSSQAVFQQSDDSWTGKDNEYSSPHSTTARPTTIPPKMGQHKLSPPRPPAASTALQKIDRSRLPPSLVAPKNDLSLAPRLSNTTPAPFQEQDKLLLPPPPPPPPPKSPVSSPILQKIDRSRLPPSLILQKAKALEEPTQHDVSSKKLELEEEAEDPQDPSSSPPPSGPMETDFFVRRIDPKQLPPSLVLQKNNNNNITSMLEPELVLQNSTTILESSDFPLGEMSALYSSPQRRKDVNMSPPQQQQQQQYDGHDDLTRSPTRSIDMAGVEHNSSGEMALFENDDHQDEAPPLFGERMAAAARQVTCVGSDQLPPSLVLEREASSPLLESPELLPTTTDVPSARKQEDGGNSAKGSYPQQNGKGGNFRQVRNQMKQQQQQRQQQQKEGGLVDNNNINSNGGRKSPCRNAEERCTSSSSAYPKQKEKGGNFRQIRNELKQLQSNHQIANDKVEIEEENSKRDNGKTIGESSSSAYPKQTGKGGNFRQIRNEAKQRWRQGQNEQGSSSGSSTPERQQQQQQNVRNVSSRERRESEKIMLDRGDDSAVDVASSSRGQAGKDRRARRMEKEADQGNHAAVSPGHGSRSSREPATTGNDRRARRMEKEADQGNRAAVSPDGLRSSGGAVTTVSSPSSVSPPELVYEVSDGPQMLHDDIESQNLRASNRRRSSSAREKAIASDGGEAQAVNYRARPRPLSQHSEGDDDYSDDDEDMLPGAFNVTTRGVVGRQKGQLTDSFRNNNSIQTGSTPVVSIYSSARTSASKESSKMDSSDGISDLPSPREIPAITVPPQVPDVPIPPESPTNKEFISLQRPCLLKIAVLCLLIVVAVSVSIPLALSDKDPLPTVAPASPTVSPSMTPTMTPTFSSRAVGFISRLGNVSDVSAFEDRTTPQAKAVVWLADTDTSALRLDSDYSLILERYVAALIFFSWAPEDIRDIGDVNDEKYGKIGGIQFLESVVCGWQSKNRNRGIFCDGDQLISEINFAAQNLPGTIPAEIFSLPSLRTLRLESNLFTGTLPSEIGLCTTLETIRIGQNSLTGSIPSTIGSLGSLRALDLSDSAFDGNITSSLFNLPALEILSLRGTRFTGTLSSEIWQLTSLKNLNLNSVRLAYTIPTELGWLSNLRSLELGDNLLLDGTIPSEIGMLSEMDRLRLGSTELTSTIPTEIGQLTGLQILDLEFTALTGTIPTEMAGLFNLTVLRISFLLGVDDPSSVVESLCTNNSNNQICIEFNKGCGCCTGISSCEIPSLSEAIFED